MGLTTRRSLKVWEYVQGYKVVVLIDCGVTHNIISTELVSKLRLLIADTSPYYVEVGGAHKIECGGMCQGFQ